MKNSRLNKKFKRNSYKQQLIKEKQKEMKTLMVFKLNPKIKFKISSKTKLLQRNKDFQEFLNLIKKVFWISFLAKTLNFLKLKN